MHIAWPSSAGEVGLSENPDFPSLDRCLPRSMVRKALPMWLVSDLKGLQPRLFC